MRFSPTLSGKKTDRELGRKLHNNTVALKREMRSRVERERRGISPQEIFPDRLRKEYLTELGYPANLRTPRAIGALTHNTRRVVRRRAALKLNIPTDFHRARSRSLNSNEIPPRCIPLALSPEAAAAETSKIFRTIREKRRRTA